MPSISSNSSTANTSAIKKTGLTTDVYDIANYVNEVKKEFTPDVDEDTLLLGTFGYFGAIQSDLLQNSIIMASEFANESIATKAKFDKNVISHALNLNITSLNATPARMEVLLTFLEDEIINAIGGGSGDFIFDRDNKIYFDKYEFHPDYDIIIRRVRLNNGEYTYTAMYRTTGAGVYTNPISDITNPYLTPPVVMNVNGTNYLFTYCLLRQVEKSTIYKKVLSDNTITSKTVNFSFESQLAGFDVDVTNSTDNVHLVPVYEGMDSESQYSHIWYTYLDTDTLRLKFDRDSYSPRINSNIQINLQTTQGEAGNFTWVADYPQFSFDSDRLGYSNITVQVRPVTGESMYGTNKKSIEELRKIIPREALSRGSITNTKDLKNFFNAIDSDLSQVYLYKKRSNNRDFLYYMYIVMKDALANVIPTNTVNLMIRPDQLFTDSNGSRLIVKKGSVLKLDTDGTTAYISALEAPEEDAIDYTDSFYYIIPYNFAICTDPMYGMYFLTTMDENRSLYFSYINDECLYQYIATSINWKRLYLTNDNTYTMTIEMEQNISSSNDDNSMIYIDENGNIVSNVKCFAVFYNSDNEPYRYLEGSISNFNKEANIIEFTFTMTSEDYIDQYNRIRIDGVYPTNGLSQLINYGYMPANCKTMIHIVTKQPEYSTKLTYTDLFYDEVDLSTIIPGLDGWTISNSYSVNNGVNFFYNYSDIIYSTVSIGDGEYIPPDEPTKPEEPESPDYNIGGDDIDPNPTDHILLTEAGLYNAILKAIDEVIREVPKFGTDSQGTLYYKEGDNVHVFGDDDMDIEIPDEEETEEPVEDEITYGDPKAIYEVGGYQLEITPDVYTLATEICVTNAINKAYAKALDYIYRYGTDEDGTVYIKKASEIFTINDDDNTVEIPEDSEPTIVTNDDEHYLTPPTYNIGSANLSNNPDVYTIATELAAYRAISNMKQNLLDNAAKVSVDTETGAVSIYDAFKSTTLSGNYTTTEDTPETDDPSAGTESTHSVNTNRTVNANLVASDNIVTPSMRYMTKNSGAVGYTTPEEDSKKFHYIVENVPVLKYGYFRNEDMVKYFMDELVRRKNYIDEALLSLEDLFGINFKFVNTYGPSRLFTLDNDSAYINRVNLTLTFRLGLQVNYDDNIIQYITDDIKTYIEDINSIDSIHMSNLVTEITTKYADSIRFFEFVDMNGYGPSEQHLYAMPMPDDVITPELVNVNTLLPDQVPDINIIIA